MVKLIGSLLLFVLVAAPFVIFAWHTLSEILAGRFHSDQALLAALAVAVLVTMLRMLGRYLTRAERVSG